jgi:hypothetical protein
MHQRKHVFILSAFLLAGCVANEPYRTSLAPVCATPLGPAQSCSSSFHETSDSFDLLFAEFDDQGLPYPRPGAKDQQAKVIKALDDIAATNDHRVAVYVFVTGWKNNANEDDGNITGFKKALAVAARDEVAKNPAEGSKRPRRVVGIFVSWRGLATTLEPFKELSFWTRKAAADRVAHGSARGFFSMLKLFQCEQNGNLSCSLEGTKTASKNVRLVLIGHSFGALILYNAVEQALVESLVPNSDNPAPPPVPRFGDMVILLNPAFEASLYAPLKEIADGRNYPPHEPPIFVSVTSQTDWATGLAFPIGRTANAFLENTADPAEGAAITHTMGHIDSYITHHLTVDDSIQCEGWKDVGEIQDPAELRAQVDKNLAAENNQRRRFYAQHPTLSENWERQFCGGARLTHTQGIPNSVVWNIEADKSIMNGHSDLTEPAFISFMRQLSSDPLYEEQ